MAHTYDVGTKAWQPDPTEGWVASEVEQKIVDGNSVKLVFQLANGEVQHVRPALFQARGLLPAARAVPRLRTWASEGEARRTAR